MNLSGIPRKSLVGRLLRLPLRAIPSAMPLPILQGRLRGLRWIAGSGTHGCWLGSYEYEKRKLFERTVSPGEVVYDIGANAGFYALLASVLVGADGLVAAFEPNPRNLRYLRLHLRLNGATNVRVLPFAVSDRMGSARFDPGPSPSMGALSPSGSLEVTTVTLDAMVASGHLPPPTVVKIDVEGAEAAVLRGAQRLLAEQRPGIFLATHGPRIHAECVELLGSLGYGLTPINAASVESADELVALPVPG